MAPPTLAWTSTSTLWPPPSLLGSFDSHSPGKRLKKQNWKVRVPSILCFIIISSAKDTHFTAKPTHGTHTWLSRLPQYRRFINDSWCSLFHSVIGACLTLWITSAVVQQRNQSHNLITREGGCGTWWPGRVSRRLSGSIQLSVLSLLIWVVIVIVLFNLHTTERWSVVVDWNFLFNFPPSRSYWRSSLGSYYWSLYVMLGRCGHSPNQWRATLDLGIVQELLLRWRSNWFGFIWLSAG